MDGTFANGPFPHCWNCIDRRSNFFLWCVCMPHDELILERWQTWKNTQRIHKPMAWYLWRKKTKLNYLQFLWTNKKWLTELSCFLKIGTYPRNFSTFNIPIGWGSKYGTDFCYVFASFYFFLMKINIDLIKTFPNLLTQFEFCLWRKKPVTNTRRTCCILIVQKTCEKS